MRVVYDKLGKRTGAPPFLRLPELWKERVERMENAKKKSRKKYLITVKMHVVVQAYHSRSLDSGLVR